MARNPQLSSSVQQRIGIPPGLKFYSPYPFGGMNLQDAGPSIEDNEFLWLENFLRIGKGKLRTAWDIGTPLYTAPPSRTIIYFFFYTIGVDYYVVIFLDDGSAVQVNTQTSVPIQIGGAGTFYKGTDLPACAQWGTLYLLISNRNSNNDYWVWDGVQLYASGTAAPGSEVVTYNGVGYSSEPTVTPFGGHGSGIVVKPTINAGGVVDLQITNPGSGYEVGDVVQLQFSGGGSDTSAIVMANLAAGGVTAVNVTAEGSGYTTATISFSGGGGSGAAGVPIISSGIGTITITTPGSGYTMAGISFTGGGGTGAAATIQIVGGQVVGATITNNGSGYTSLPTVAITGDGTGATASVTIQGGAITGVTMTAPGSGYTSAPSVTFTGDGSGAAGVAALSGNLISTTVVQAGTNYIRAPLVTVKGGGGSGATAYAELQPTFVASVNVTSAGQNYGHTPEVDFRSGGPNAVEATGNAVLVNGGVGQVIVTNGGSNYTTQPFVSFTPEVHTNSDNVAIFDPGTGAAAEALMNPVGIADVIINNRGMGYTDAPAIVLGPGGNNAAAGTIDLMPYGLSGGSLETFQQRVWLANPAPPQFGPPLPPGGNFTVTAPGSFIDAATSDGGVLFTNSDGFLQTKYTGIKQSNGYLYFFGDGSISIVSSVNTSGNPATTTFNYQNVDPQIGMSFRDSIQPFSKTILFANETGIFGLYGGTAVSASQKLQDLFNQAIFPPTADAVQPSSACATLFDIRHYMMLMTAQDPDTGGYRNVMATWNEKEWAITSQSATMTFIGTQKVESKLFAWGTDGSKLYPMFEQPSTLLTKRIDSKWYGGGQSAIVTKNMDAFYMVAQDQSSPAAGINVDVAFALSGLIPQPPDAPDLATVQSGTVDNLTNLPVTYQAPPPYWPLFYTGMQDNLYFSELQMKLSTTSPDFILNNFMVAYFDWLAATG